jgi:transcriptional regulator with XRE-family HTH domain
MTDETFRHNLEEAMRSSGVSAQQLSMAAGLGRTAVHDILKGHSRQPRPATILALARALGVKPEDLYGGPLPEEASNRSHQPAQILDPTAGSGGFLAKAILGTKRRPPTIPTLEFAGRWPSGPRDLPILGEARGGADGVFLHNGDTLAYSERPPSLVGVRNAYAVIMRGTSMEPRYYDGDLLQVHPLKPVHAMNFVHFEMRDGQSFVKQYLRRDDEWVTVRQLNPEATIKIKSTEIRWLRRITGSTDDW